MTRLIDRIGDDTIGRLERAAEARLAEAIDLTARGRHMAAIYLGGYAAELVIGAAYFRLLGFSPNEPISHEDLTAYLKASRGYLDLSHPAHPLDGEVRLLVAERARRLPRARIGSLDEEVVKRVDSICQQWSHRLRYRSIEVDEGLSREVIQATRWLLEHYSEL